MGMIKSFRCSRWIFSDPKVIVTALGIMVSVASMHDANAFLGTDEYDISSFCNTPSARRTIIYVDDEIMEDQNTSWATRLYQKLNASFLPSEPVSVVQLSPSSGTAKEVWSACWPDYAQEEKDKLAKGQSWFTKAPLKVLETQQSVFRQGLRVALSRIYESGRRPKQEIVTNKGKKKKQIVAAIMADESRFHVSRSSARVIIYSDMIENSEYANIEAEGDFEKLGTQVSERLKFDSEGATVYAFGVGGAVDQGQKSIDRAREFWTAFLRRANGYIGGFGPELNIPAAPAVLIASYDVEVKVKTTPLFGRLRIFADAKGQLQDSYIFFTTKANSSIDGAFVCRNVERCVLDAKTTSGTITLSAREEIKLEGPMQKLVGTLGFPNDYVQGGNADPQNKANWDVNAILKSDR